MEELHLNFLKSQKTTIMSNLAKKNVKSGKVGKDQFQPEKYFSGVVHYHPTFNLN